MLIDELGTSTDPEEGAALAKAILRELHRRGIPTIATSHHRDLAAFVQDSPGMTNASVELDPDTLSPTYKLNIGLPERSYALTIATKLGMPQAVIDDARSMLSPEFRQTEGLLSELQLERRQAVERSREAQEELRQAREFRQELEQRLAGLEQERDWMIAESRRELEARAEEVRQRLRAVERSLPAARQPQPAPPLHQQRQEVLEVKKELQSPAWRGETARDRWLGTLRRGDLIIVRGIGQALEVLTEPSEQGSLEVALGSIRVTVSLDEIERRVEAAGPATRCGGGRNFRLQHTSPRSATSTFEAFAWPTRWTGWTASWTRRSLPVFRLCGWCTEWERELFAAPCASTSPGTSTWGHSPLRKGIAATAQPWLSWRRVYRSGAVGQPPAGQLLRMEYP